MNYPKIFSLSTREGFDSQLIFERWLKENAYIVYGETTKEGGMGEWPMNFGHARFPNSTHKALLICVEEIKKPCLKHEPKEGMMCNWTTTCKHCGVKLIAEWIMKE